MVSADPHRSMCRRLVVILILMWIPALAGAAAEPLGKELAVPSATPASSDGASEPFGLRVGVVADRSRSLGDKWRTVSEQARREIQNLGPCLVDAAMCHSAAARRFAAIIAVARSR